MKSPSRNTRRFKRTSIILTLLFLAIATSALILFSHSRSQLKVAIVLVSPPQLMPGTAEFYVYQPAIATYLVLTQNFYHAEIQVRNIGTSSITADDAVSIEIMEAHSTNWICPFQPALGMMYPIVKPGDSMNFRFRIPASATKWRAAFSYQRWFIPQRVINHVLRDWLNLQTQVGDDKIYDAQAKLGLSHRQPTSRESDAIESAGRTSLIHRTIESGLKVGSLASYGLLELSLTNEFGRAWLVLDLLCHLWPCHLSFILQFALCSLCNSSCLPAPFPPFFPQPEQARV